jgi:prolipoprotein diacylglyceryltransferase
MSHEVQGTGTAGWHDLITAEGKVGISAFPLQFRSRGDMNYQTVFRHTILVISAAAMVVGVLVMAGVLVPRNFPDQYGVLIGAVIFLYGAYRFVITYFRRME